VGIAHPIEYNRGRGQEAGGRGRVDS